MNDHAHKVWYLKKINLFKEMEDEDINLLETLVMHKEYKRKEFIFLPDDPGDKVYCLKEGIVRIAAIAPSGKEMTLTIMEPGEVFGELALLDGDRRQTLAQAVVDSTVCLIRRKDFQAFLEKRPTLSLRVTKMIGERVRELESRLSDIVFKDVPGRLASLFLRLAEKYGRPHARGTLLDIRLTHQELANLIGATRETTSVNLGRMKQQGLIAVDDHRIVIVKEEQLRKLGDEY
jgi:CRP/FNR family cyclic AMP-dependent transcriptional regulator